MPENGVSTVAPNAALLEQVSRRVRWLATAIVDVANHDRPNASGVKVGGHQASSASMVEIMVALWFHELRHGDRVSVKPHASPVLHAINYLLGNLDVKYLSTLRSRGGLQSYPSRAKDPDPVDFSTGSVGIGATAPLWAALAHRYVRSHVESAPRAGRFISLLGDAELDEGAIWEAICDPKVASMGELLWVVDLNRQSLDQVVPDIQIERLTGMFAAAGWEVVTLKWGKSATRRFMEPGGAELRRRLEDMPNEEFQRLLRVPQDDLVGRLLRDDSSQEMRSLVGSLTTEETARILRNLGGHDLELLVDAFAHADGSRPTVVFAYTVKGRGLPTEGHPNNHSALLAEQQMRLLANECGTSYDDPWQPFLAGTAEAALCQERQATLRREPIRNSSSLQIPTSLSRSFRKPVSTQAVFGHLLADLAREAPEASARVVTCSPDVASSTNLGGWINKVGVWTSDHRRDWFSDDTQRILRWVEDAQGQHIELGIAEVNLVSLLGELGATWSRWGERLIPVGTLYDPFVARALEPWSYGIYAGGQSILVGTPSGVSLAPEGGAHQSITTPSIGVEQPRCTYWEPAFAEDTVWCFLAAMAEVGVPGGQSAYLRLSTRPVDPVLAQVPTDSALRERRRKQAIAGGYRVSEHSAYLDDLVLVGVGAVMPEVVSAAQELTVMNIAVGIVCLTSPDLVFRSLQQQGSRTPSAGGSIVQELFPADHPTPMVAVMDGHPHTLSFLAAARGDRVRSLGVRDFGQSSSLEDAYDIHGIDAAHIVDAALTLLGR
jgi:pyruvate dehydrogenase E1 component